MAAVSYFTPQEFLCHCGRDECDAPKDLTPGLRETLERLRALYGAPLTVTSGLRCDFWNRHEGGVQGSEHLTGEAVDLACRDSGARMRLVTLASSLGITRVGISHTFVHLGVGPKHPSHVLWLYRA